MKQIENRNKMTSYSENNITISIDQDPINQLVLIASNRLQSSIPNVLIHLSSQSNLSVTRRAPRAYETTIYSQEFSTQEQLQHFSNYIDNQLIQPLTHLLLKYL